jgi:DnaJ-class molecular chaperone
MDENDINYYEVLNVDKNSSIEEIRKQYKLLVLKHHPDKEGGDVVKFKVIKKAYDILSNVEDRYAYDTIQVQFEGSQKIHSFFEHIFEAENEQQKIKLGVSLNDILYGCYKKYVVKMSIPCIECRETGISNPDKNTIQCRECFGKGIHPMMSFLSCMTCNGKGIFVIQNVTCKVCSGDRMLRRMDERTIYLKPGISNNEIITLSNTLILIVEHNYENESLKIKGLDVYVYMDITLLELICGFVKEVYLGEESYCVQSKKVFDVKKPLKVSNKGIAEKGDLYIIFNLIIDVSNKLYEKLGISLNTVCKTNLEFKLSDETNVINVC